jgi:hypothetical protein
MALNRLSPFILASSASLLLAGPAFAGGRVCYDWEEVPFLDDTGAPYPGLSWWGVNNRDVFVGNFCYDEACSDQGVVIWDSRADTWDSFVIPGYGTEVDVPRINDHGIIVGSARNADGDYLSWVRDTDGTLTLIDGYIATDINDADEIVGFYPWDGWPDYPFVGATLSGRGFTDIAYYTVDGADYNGLWASNDSHGLVVTNEDLPAPPWYMYGIDLGHGVTWISWADQGGSNGAVWGLNNRGQAVGNMLRTDGGYVSFIWDRGTFTWVTYGSRPGLLDINDHGVIAGTFDNYTRGLVGWPVPCHR